jgi:hypothetical protein
MLCFIVGHVCYRKKVDGLAQSIRLVPRVARWYIFKPKIPIWVIIYELRRGCGRGWHILCPFGPFYGPLV